MKGVHSPFAALTMIVAPAMLRNASCVLAMNTINRMLKSRDRMRELLKDSEKPKASGAKADREECLQLFRATQLSMLNIREEAEVIRERAGDRARAGST